MKAHPIIDYPYRWVPMLVVALVLVVAQVMIMSVYTGADYVPAVIDGIATIGWLMALGYLAWFVVGVVSIFQTEVITLVAGILIWIAGSFMFYDIVTRIAGMPYITFASTIPFRLLFGIPTWVAILLWYRLIVAKEDALNQELEKELIMHQPVSLPEEPQIEQIDRITVKDGSKIHLIKTDELIYIQACGDYVMLITPSGEYLKEQTMKYFETHLPSDTFVRVHRSTIVNVTQISRVELFGKETYQLLLKNGVKLRVSLSGYRLLKERLGVGSQEELLQELNREGFELTQATLSRDLKQLKVAKAASMNGKYVYVLPNNIMYKRSTDQSAGEMLRNNGFISLQFSGNIAVIRTRPGYASSMAYDIDNNEFSEILGTIAGDDTIMLVLREGVATSKVRQLLSLIIPNIE